MKNLTYLTFIIGLFHQLLAAPAPITVRELALATLKNNFDLKLSKIAIDEKKTVIEQEIGDYDYRLSSSHSRAKNNTPSSSSLDGAGNASSVKSSSTSSSLTLAKKFNTGTEISIPYNVTITKSNSTTRTIAKTYEPSLTLSITQPLLKGFDATYVARDIEEARMDVEIEQLKNLEAINKKLQEALELYFDTILKHEQIGIRRTGSKNAKQNMAFITEKHRLGKASQIEYLEAKTAFQKTEDSLLTAQIDYQNIRDQLALLVFGDSNHQIDFINISQLLHNLPPLIANQEVTELIQQAITDRDKVKRYQLTLAKAGFKLANAVRDRLPDLDLAADLTHKGLGSSLSSANRHLTDGRYRSWNTSLTISKPLMAYASTAYWQQQKLKHQQEMIRMEQARRDVRLEVQKSLRKLASGKIQIKAFSAALAAEEKKYAELKIRHQQGRVSTYELNQGLQAVQNTEVSLLKAKVGHIKNYYAKASATGKLLSMIGVSINR
ncbi:MAG: TolC family protein [Bdellovibrionales bacterium]|jgi:outer membrane protein TolC|nr:TolC family protein [Bdellovibrionales bacterium]MBT3526935.1 TolC family protein [Bdellovibrionales bacterium]MBT7767469.1 TolC family protein [Bdellovibrionales bacterium]